MRQKIWILIFIFGVFILPMLANAPQRASGERPLYSTRLIKIKLHADAIQRTQLPQGLYAETRSFGINELDQLMTRQGGQRIIRAHRQLNNRQWESQTGWDRWFLVELDGRSSVEEAINAFQQNRYVERAIPEYYAYTTAVPNDAYYANNWGHNNTAQLPVYQSGGHTGAGVGTVGFDADMQLAWDQSQGYGSSSIVIAIIDSGVDTAHPDLRLITGFDFGDNDSNPMDDCDDPGHGTSCAGVAAAIANNNLGIAGAAGGSSVMPLKVANQAGVMYFTPIENAITYAADNGARVISLSLGLEGGAGEGSVPTTDAALEYAYSAGVVIFAATANADASTIAYPSNHNKVISVGASSPTGQRKSSTSSDGETWWGSNYGVNIVDSRDAVDIMGPTILPATDITGTGNGYDENSDYYMWFNGTSCATPYVAGVAALILAKDPSLTPAQVRTALVSTATDMTVDGGAGWDRYTGYGLVNANAALNSLIPGLPICSITAPSPGSSYEIGSVVNVTATASDSDGSITQVDFYLNNVWQSTDSSSPYLWNWDTAGLSSGSFTIKAVATDNAANQTQSVVTVQLYLPPDEGFESGNFTAYAWINNSSLPWTVQSSEKYAGAYAAQSGNIGNSTSTSLSLQMNVTANGNVSFFQKVSSESGYDFLKFYIDGVEQGSWSGSGVWTLQSYPVTTGSRTFTWTYSKDYSDTGGSDRAWLDNISFPTHSVYYAPPQNLSASGANNAVNLSWSAPLSGSPSSYKIYRNNSYLSSTSSLSYVDNAVSNGITYQYYLIAVYTGGESEPTATVAVTPNNMSYANIGSGTTTTGTNDASPVNIYYKSLHGQAIYTKAELNAAGIVGPVNLTELGFYINSTPTLALPNFIIRLKHSSDSNVANWQPLSGMTTVYSAASYMPVAGSYHMLSFATPFLWNGNDNIVVDTAFSPVATYSSTGTVRYSTVTNGYRYTRSDSADQSLVFSSGSTSSYRPNIRLGFSSIPAVPEISVSETSLSFGSVLTGYSQSRSFTITNTGGGILSGTITTPEGFFCENAAKGTNRGGQETSYLRSSLPFSLGSGLSGTFDVIFTPLLAQSYSGNLVITHSAEGESKQISLAGTGLSALELPFAEGWENGFNSWQALGLGQTNYWIVGAATANTGSTSAYITNDGSNNAYTLTSASVSHLYRDIAFPAGTDDFKLRFVWKGQGEGSTTFYDYLRVYLIDPSAPLTAGTALSSGQLGVTYNLSSTWAEISLDLPAGLNGQIRRLVFSWVNDGNLGNQAPAAIDDIRIVSGNQSDAAVVIDNTLTITPPPVTIPDLGEVNPSLVITDIGGSPSAVVVTTGFASVASPFENAGLDFVISGADLGGANLNITHDLGFTPLQLVYRLGDAGDWVVVNDPGTWSSTTADFSVPSAKAEGDLVIIFPNNSEETLPLTLQSFQASLAYTGGVCLNWVSATETGLLGYYLYRSESELLEAADMISDLITGTNTSSEQQYSFTDAETIPGTTYNYWLQGLDMDGWSAFYGPISIQIPEQNTNNGPGLPQITALLSNIPNPFNPETAIHYALDRAGRADFEIFNSRGQKVRSFSTQHSAAGYYSWLFNGRTDSGAELSSGVYYCRMLVNGISYQSRMLLLK